MKKSNYLFALIVMIASFSTFAQKTSINSETSTIKWLGKKVTGQHEGLIKIKSGSLELNNGEITAGDFIIDMSSITCTDDLGDETYNQKLVGHLKSEDFFGVEKYPEATLKITKAAKFVNKKATVTGDLTIKDKTEAITFDLMEDNGVYMTKLDIDRTKFGIKYGSNSFFDSLGDKAIDNIFTLDIKLVTK